VQYRPDAAELLDAVASLLEADVITSVPPHLQHQVRVAANLCRILERETQLAGTNDDAERVRLSLLLALIGNRDDTNGDDTNGDDTNGDDRDVRSLRADLVARLDDPAPLDAVVERSVREALLDTLRADLTIAKPGYAAPTGAP